MSEMASKIDIEKKYKVHKLEDLSTWTDYFQANKLKIPRIEPAVEGEVEGEAVKKAYEAKEDFNGKISLWRGDITLLEIDVITNAANKSLLGGGGVDGAIHRAAGPDLVEECKTLGGCPPGDAKITKGYNLPSKHVIHTVGPIGEKPDLLKSCYKKSLALLLENDLRTIAFPCISTGIYGYPNEEAAHVALRQTRKFLEKNSEKVDRIIFCIFLEKDLEIYEELLQIYFPVPVPVNETPNPSTAPDTPADAASN